MKLNYQQSLDLITKLFAKIMIKPCRRPITQHMTFTCNTHTRV